MDDGGDTVTLPPISNAPNSARTRAQPRADYSTPEALRRKSMIPPGAVSSARAARRHHSTLIVPSFTKTHWDTRFLANWPASRTFQKHQDEHERVQPFRHESVASDTSTDSPNRARRRGSRGRPRPSSTSLHRRISTHAKPAFLSNLEDLLSRKLRRTSLIPDALEQARARFSAHRDIFRSFVGHFATYRPLLTSLLHSYDQHVDSLERRVVGLEENQTQFHSLEADCDIQLHELQRRHNGEMKKLHDSVSVADDARETAVTESEEATSELHAVQRDYAHVQSELKDMRLNAETLTSGLREATEEVMQLKVQLREADARVKTHRRIQTLYRDALKRMRSAEQMVKKGEFDQVMDECRQYKSLSERLNAQLRAMRRANEKLTHDVIRLRLELRSGADLGDPPSRSSARGQRTAASTEVGEDGVPVAIRRTHTPRPNWSSIKRILPSFDPDRASTIGIARQLETYIVELQETIEKQKSRLGKQEKILSYMNDRSLLAKQEQAIAVNTPFFVGKGTHSRIPPYLRFNGKVRNRCMTKAQVEDLIEDIWSARKAKLTRHQQSFDDFFDHYLETKFGTAPAEKAEWCYSLLHGCEKYRFDPDCDLFLKVLRREISEDCYDEQFQLIESLKGEFEKLDLVMNTEIAGLVRKSEVFAMLDTFFQAKSASDLNEIKVVLSGEREVFEYAKLFDEDEHHTQSEFIETIRSQYIVEVEEFTVDVEQELWSMVIDDGSIPRLTLKQIRDAFQMIDPRKPVREVVTLINHGLDRPPTTKIQTWKQVVGLGPFLAHLKARVLRRTTPKELVDQVLEEISRRRVREFQYSQQVTDMARDLDDRS